MKLYSTKMIARYLDLSERRIRQLRDEGIIAESGPGMYELLPTIHSYINYLRQRNPEGSEAVSYHLERAKLARAKRMNEEYDLALKEGRLLNADEVEYVVSNMLLTFKARLMELPAKEAPTLAKLEDQAQIYDILKNDVDEALNELSDFRTAAAKMQSDEGGEDGAVEEDG